MLILSVYNKFFKYFKINFEKEWESEIETLLGESQHLLAAFCIPPALRVLSPKPGHVP